MSGNSFMRTLRAVEQVYHALEGLDDDVVTYVLDVVRQRKNHERRLRRIQRFGVRYIHATEIVDETVQPYVPAAGDPRVEGTY